LGWVHKLMGWVGLGEEKWTHVHLWDIQTDRHQNWQTRQLMAITLRASAYIFVNDAQSWPNSKTIKVSICPNTSVGHTIGSGLHGPDPNKVACVQAMKPPNSKKEATQLLGFSHIFGQIRGYS